MLKTETYWVISRSDGLYHAGDKGYGVGWTKWPRQARPFFSKSEADSEVEKISKDFVTTVCQTTLTVK